MKVFLSYSHTDRHAAAQLIAALRVRGIAIWDGAIEILAGDNWALRTGSELEAADGMIVLISPESMMSPAVNHEIDYALTQRRFKNRLVSVLVRPTEDIPAILSQLGVIRYDDAEATADKIAAHFGRVPVLA